jgi:hypothetical protein
MSLFDCFEWALDEAQWLAQVTQTRQAIISCEDKYGVIACNDLDCNATVLEIIGVINHD